MRWWGSLVFTLKPLFAFHTHKRHNLFVVTCWVGAGDGLQTSFNVMQCAFRSKLHYLCTSSYILCAGEGVWGLLQNPFSISMPTNHTTYLLLLVGWVWVMACQQV